MSTTNVGSGSQPRIVTLTANPSLDRTIALTDALRPGEVQLAASAREDAGGKGINVSRAVAAAGVSTVAVLPLAADDPFATALGAAKVPALPVPIDGHSRANLTITDPAGVTTKLNLPGAALTPAGVEDLIAAVVAASEGADWLVLAGSLPPGAEDSLYVEIIRAVRARWGIGSPRVAVDTSGAALRAVVYDASPDLIKPNDEELAELAGIELEAGGILADAVLPVAQALVPARVAAALVTLGADGAVLVTSEGAWVAVPPRIRVVSTVGAGDSSLAGYLLGDVSGAGPAEALRRSVQYGAAAASLPGTQAPTPDDLPSGEVIVRPLGLGART
ncbi:1-phosphofructokinase [Microbacterium pygmaeum]|uniref:1-phosphofructokinase n=1 Tax=Microbacterium pygmaeum TaxID=370764 RepID=A0A1G7ZXJ5_9MICO|nr:1-phosphofructokinase [Microbacterium pygmaeum]SDH13418.1 1-phosphofructokinase [Microbacterium pygmaeum]